MWSPDRRRSLTCPLNSKISAVGRILAIVTFLILLGLGILAFIMTLNVREESMPPIPSTERYIPDLKNLRNEMKDFVDDDDEGEAAPGENSEQEVSPDQKEPDTDELQGRVLDKGTGDPIAEFEIGLAPVGMDKPNWQVFVTWVPIKRSDGQFSVPMPSPAAVHIGARARGYQPQWESLGTDTGSYTFRLAPGPIIYGTIVDAGGYPVEGAAIIPDPDPDAAQPIGYSDGGGQFEVTLSFVTLELDGVTPVTVTHPDFMPSTVYVHVRPGREELRIVLSSGGVIAGHVFQGTTPAAGCRIHAVLSHWDEGQQGPIMSDPARTNPNLFLGPFPAPAVAETDADGRYEMRALYPGEYRVSAKVGEEECAAWLNRRAIVEDGSTSGVDFHAPLEHASLTLNLRVEGETPSFVNAQLLSMLEDCEVRIDLRPVEPGVYGAACVPSGPGILHVTATRDKETMFRTVRDFTFQPDTTVEETIELGFRGHIVGTVQREPETYNVVFALFGRLDIDRAEEYSPSELMMRAALHADTFPEGQFDLTPLERGDYTIVAVTSSERLLEGPPPADLRIQARHVTVNDTAPIIVDFRS